MDLQELLLSPKKTYWTPRLQKPVSFFCPVCKIQRKLPFHPHPQSMHYFQVFLGSAVITLLTWQWFSWKGIVSFLPLWTAFEIMYRARARAALICNDCGFDPFLFLVDQKLATKEIQNHWRKKFEEKGLIPPKPTEPTESAPQA